MQDAESVGSGKTLPDEGVTQEDSHAYHDRADSGPSLCSDDLGSDDLAFRAGSCSVRPAEEIGFDTPAGSLRLQQLQRPALCWWWRRHIDIRRHDGRFEQPPSRSTSAVSPALSSVELNGNTGREEEAFSDLYAPAVGAGGVASSTSLRAHLR